MGQMPHQSMVLKNALDFIHVNLDRNRRAACRLDSCRRAYIVAFFATALG